MHTRSALLPAIALSAMLLGGAAPLPPSPEQAKLLEAQITAWLTTMTGGMVKLPPQPVQLTPEGDHYLVHVPLGRLGTIDPPDAAFTAQARSLGGTRWALDNQQFPTALTIKTTEKEAAAPASDDAPATPQTVDVTYRLKIGQQDANSILDIAFATPTSGSSTFTAVDLLKEGGTAASLTHVDQIVSQSSTQPLDPAHADLLSDVTATGYAMKGSTPDGKNVALQIGRMHIVSTLSGLAHQQFVPLIEMAADLAHMTQASAGDKHDSLTPEEKAQLHTMLEQAHDILTGGKIDETLEALKFGMDDNAGSIERAELSVSGDAPADTLSASSTLSMTGLKIDSLPPEVAAYVPTRFTIHPTMSNLDLAALTKMALDATAPTLKGQPAAPNPSIAALFSKGGVHFGFDDLGLDVAGLEITGTGAFTSPDPNSFAGQAELSARGLDALITQVQSNPLLVRGVPALIFLKGIAKTTGDRSTWQITVDNATILVNGVDLSAMMGAMGQK